MKKLLFFLMTLMALCFSWNGAVKAQTTVTIGEGTSTQYYPLPGFYGYNYDVFLYTPSEAAALDADCNIQSIAFNVSQNSVNAGAQMAIWVKDVDANYALAAGTTFAEYIDGATMVYEITDLATNNWWNIFPFSTGFQHEGGKALLVAVRGVGCSGSGGCARQCYYTSAQNTNWYKRQDSSDPGTNVSGTLSGNRANIQLSLTYTGNVCLTPSGLAANNLTHESATLTWAENGSATSWVLQYGTDNTFATYTEQTVNTTPSFNITSGLNTSTTYYARVKPACDNDGTHWSNTTTFTTTAQATVVGDSWSDDFEGPTCGWELINGDLTNAWAWGTATNNGGTHALYVSNDGGATNAYTHGNTMIYATKLLNFAGGKYEFSYNWNGNGESTYDYMRVALVPASVTLTASTSYPYSFSSSNLPSDWIALDGGGKLNLVTAWQNKSVAINVAAGNYYLVFAWRNDGNGGSNPPAAVDNVTITRFACPYDVNDLAVVDNSITTNGATVTWTAGEATEWQVAYKKAADAEWTILPTTFTTASAQLTGLTASTAYQVRVRAYCNANDQGAWCDPINFPTECDVIPALGYSEYFDTYTAGNNVLPLCWSYINTTTYSSYQGYPKVYNYNAYSQSNSLYFYSYSSSTYDYDPQPQYAILPEMNDLTGKRITLQARGNNSTSTFKVGTMSDPTDASSFEEITNSENPAAMTTSYQEYIFDIPSTTNRYVAIMIEAANSTSNYNGVYIDDIVFTLSPTCYKPTEAHADVADANNATISWTPDARNVAGGSYSILDAEFNVVEGADNLTGTSFALTGLTPETSYTYYVRTNCFNTAENVDDVVVSFSTPADCAAPVLSDNAFTDITAHNATVTWTGFTSNDEYAVRYRSAAYLDGINEEFNGTSLPAGWAQYSGVLDNVLAGTATLSSATSWYNTSYGLGSYNWKINVYNTKNAWMVTPNVNIPANCALSFDVALTKWNDNSEPPSSKMPDANSKFIVLASNDNMSTWTVLREWNNTGSSDVLNNISNTANNFTIDLSGYEGDDVRVAFYVECASGPDCDLHIDNVTIGAAIPAGDWQTVTPNPTTTSTTLTGLTAETPYEVKVNGVCNGSEEENGSDIQSFTTTVACPDPTDLACPNVAAHTADLTWNVNGNPTTNYVLTKNGEESNIVVTINEGVASYQLQGLNGETAYTVKVKANCGELDGYSSESNEINFTTQISCHTPTDFVASGETTTSMVLSWTNGSEGQDAWVIAYKKDGDADFTEKNVTTNPYTLGELEDGKTYTLKIRANCGETDGMSQWSGEITNATEASCATPTNLTVSDVNGHGATISWTDTPVEGKNYIVMVASENMDLNVDFENNSIPTNFTNDDTYPWYVVANTYSGAYCVRSGGYNINYAESELTVDVTLANDATITFSAKISSEEDWDKGYFYIDETVQTDLNGISGNGNWINYSYNLSAGAHTLKWKYEKDSYGYSNDDCFYVDNIKITAGASDYAARPATTATSLELDDLDPETTYYVKVIGDCGSATSPESDVETFTTPAACNAPTSLTYDDESVTAHTVDLSWTENNGATAWKVVYSKTNINNSETTIDIDENDVTINGTTITYPLTGLDGETNYTVRVKSNCGGVHNDISAESNSTSFTTLPACYPVGDVITTDITAYTVTVHWSDYYNAGAYIVKQGDNVLDGTTTPSVNIDAENHTAIISGLEPEHTYTYGTFTVFANCGTEGLSAGTNVPYFQTEPSCHPVTNVTITGKTTNSVTFTWQDMHTPETYIIKEGEEVLSDVTTPHSVVIDATNHTATISGLGENETYSAGTFKVFADCGSTDGQSAGVNVPAFTTPCSAVTEFPWAEDFNSLTVANTIPDCWNNEEGTTTSATYKWCYTTGTASGGCNGRGHNGSNCVRFNSYSNSNGYTNFLKSPALSLPAGQPMLLTFWYKNPAGGDFSVYISTDGGTTHETSLATGLTGVANWTKYEAIDLGDYAGQEVVIVFKGTSNYGSNDAYIYLDDVTVEPYNVEKAIEANKWYAISSPVHNSGNDETLKGVTNLTTAAEEFDYDLYGYTEATGYWDKPTTVLEQGKGYIYRRSSNTTLNFVGINNSSVPAYQLSYACTNDNDLKGFNLVGNPYPLPATCGMPCYRLTTTGTWHAELISYNVPVCEAVLVKTNSTDNDVSFTTTSAKSATNAPALAFTVSNDEYEDVAYAILDGQGDAQNSSLPKIGHLEPNAPALSIPVGGKNYAIATLGSNSKSFDMAFSGMGDYTISVDANANVNYLHLIDKLTGSDIDLLLNNSYSFRASIGDNASRFVVKLVPGGDNGNAGNFAFWNGTGWTVEGEGPLYVFDALGRKILSMDVDTQTTINKSQLPSTGVYILRLGEKTQKIVVK